MASITHEDRFPIYLITGFLGAGKTTLLNRLLEQGAGRRHAVIVNEYGELGIDGALLDERATKVIELADGCLCCALADDLPAAIERLAWAGPWDAVFVETSGLADSVPIIRSLTAEPTLTRHARLAAVLTVVDARADLAELRHMDEAASQIASADLLVVAKSDLVDRAAAAAFEVALNQLNPLAEIATVSAGRKLGHALLQEFDVSLNRLERASSSGKDHGHDRGIASVSLTCDRALSPMRATRWLDELLQARGADILRAKGIMAVLGEPRRVVMDIAGGVLRGRLDRPWRPDEDRVSRMVVIGRGLDPVALRAGLEGSVA